MAPRKTTPEPNGLKFLSVRVEEKVLAKLERNGKKHQRNLSAEVRFALQQYVERLKA